jgi:hypothetical protein
VAAASSRVPRFAALAPFRAHAAERPYRGPELLGRIDRPRVERWAVLHDRRRSAERPHGLANEMRDVGAGDLLAARRPEDRWSRLAHRRNLYRGAPRIDRTIDSQRRLAPELLPRAAVPSREWLGRGEESESLSPDGQRWAQSTSHPSPAFSEQWRCSASSAPLRPLRFRRLPWLLQPSVASVYFVLQQLPWPSSMTPPFTLLAASRRPAAPSSESPFLRSRRARRRTGQPP